MIRARIQDSNLRLESMKIGSVTQTDIGIMYIQGNADKRIVEEIKERLKEIKVDVSLSRTILRNLSGMIVPLFSHFY